MGRVRVCFEVERPISVRGKEGGGESGEDGGVWEDGWGSWIT